MKAYINKRTNYKCEYDLKYPWPDNTIFKPMYDKDSKNNKINYSFDVYVESPETIIMTNIVIPNSPSFEECEDLAWKEYTSYIKCHQHEYELINPKLSSTAHVCKKCNLIPLEKRMELLKEMIAGTVGSNYA